MKYEVGSTVRIRRSFVSQKEVFGSLFRRGIGNIDGSQIVFDEVKTIFQDAVLQGDKLIHPGEVGDIKEIVSKEVFNSFTKIRIEVEFFLVRFFPGTSDGIFTRFFLSDPNRREFRLLTKPCKHCLKPLTTTSRVQIVHDECRPDYYKSLRRGHYERKVYNLPYSQIKRNRSRYFLNDQPCAACGFILITKKKKFYNLFTKKIEEYPLCPNCLAKFRMGLLKPFSWEEIKESL